MEKQHKGGIARLKQINSSHSALKGKINLGKLQTCGHSKGGGGSLWASSELRGDLKTTIGMAPYREEFSGSALSSITAATFIQAGASDTLATPSMTRGEYSSLPSTISKKYSEYSGYGHLAWDRASGSTASRLSGDIIAWMRYYMNGDTSYASTLKTSSGTAKHEWVDKGITGSNSSGSSSGGGSTNTGNTGGAVVPVTSGTTTLEAESAAIVSGKVETEHAGYSGSGYANTDNAAGKYIEFSTSANQAGVYKLTFTYALTSGNRYASIQVNGSVAVSNLDFNATGAWTTWGTSSATVNLPSGSNKIRVTAEQSEGLPNIDKMQIVGSNGSGGTTSNGGGAVNPPADNSSGVSANRARIEFLLNRYFAGMVTMAQLEAAAAQSGINIDEFDIDAWAAQNGFGNLDNLTQMQALNVGMALMKYFGMM